MNITMPYMGCDTDNLELAYTALVLRRYVLTKLPDYQNNALNELIKLAFPDKSIQINEEV